MDEKKDSEINSEEIKEVKLEIVGHYGKLSIFISLCAGAIGIGILFSLLVSPWAMVFSILYILVCYIWIFEIDILSPRFTIISKKKKK